ncbi:hypothetical protein [Sphingomonas sp.]|uniref:hypothetical protein n=1 Tax=Sphingomonas sp. TaxID=28214 RepID=UPI001B24BDF9|nr:hypothetical protein [Sphingomonas sp.]MBO9712978.1 hypothetical protein [Sphingomonas sp.]
MMAPGIRAYGVAAIALGVVGLVWGDFATTWQPVPEDLPNRMALAYAAAFLLIASGGLLQLQRAPRTIALIPAGLYAAFAVLWAIRVAGYPAIFGTWLGLAEQLALVIGGGAVVALRSGGARLALACRLGFGACLVVFGVAHWIYVKETAAMVPGWLPPSGEGWAIATGAFHALAGLALLSGVRALLAARLVVAMFVGFGLLVWLPQLAPWPGTHLAWGGNAINLALVGAAWAVADMIRAIRPGAAASAGR